MPGDSQPAPSQHRRLRGHSEFGRTPPLRLRTMAQPMGNSLRKWLHIAQREPLVARRRSARHCPRSVRDGWASDTVSAELTKQFLPVRCLGASVPPVGETGPGSSGAMSERRTLRVVV